MPEDTQVCERPLPSRRRRLPVYAGMTIAQAEKLLVLATLEAALGDKILAARHLGISVRTLYHRLTEYGGAYIQQRKAG